MEISRADEQQRKKKHFKKATITSNSNRSKRRIKNYSISLLLNMGKSCPISFPFICDQFCFFIVWHLLGGISKRFHQMSMYALIEKKIREHFTEATNKTATVMYNKMNAMCHYPKCERGKIVFKLPLKDSQWSLHFMTEGIPNSLHDDKMICRFYLSCVSALYLVDGGFYTVFFSCSSSSGKNQNRFFQ